MHAASAAESTNVRSVTVPWLVRAGFAAADAFAPSLASLAAERLFLTPPRRKPSRREREALSGGDPFVVESGKDRLRAWRFGSGPAVLLVHGWGGRSGQMAAFIPPFVDAGCSVVAFDAPAHGGSTGRLSSGIAFAEAVAAVATSVGARAAIGHSMGAAGIGWAIARGLALDTAVMLAPPRGASAYFRVFCDALALREPARDALRARIRRRYGHTPEEFDLPRAGVGTSTPLLVVHDRNDRDVPFADGEAIATAWPGAALLTTEGLGHKGILRNASVADRASAFVLGHLGRCGCGRLARDGGRCGGCALERELYERSGRAASAL